MHIYIYIHQHSDLVYTVCGQSAPGRGGSVDGVWLAGQAGVVAVAFFLNCDGLII